MQTIDLLEEALQLAAMRGYEVRREWMVGTTGGACRLGNQKVLFVNLSLTAAEQLEQVIAALRTQINTADGEMSRPLRKLLGISHP